MESTKTIKGRMQNKHGTEADWYAAGTAANPFCPLEGELIIYDPDAIYKQPRSKYGDGKTPVHLLPWVDGCEDTIGLQFELSEDGDYYACTGFDPQFKKTAEILSLNIPKGFRGIRVSKIKTEAFVNQNSFETAILPVCQDWVLYNAFISCGSLKSVFIPKGSKIASESFVNNGEIVFYCEDGAQPEDWQANWLPSNSRVVWGATMDILKLNEKMGTIGVATQENNGLMSAEDKKKLDEIATSLTPEDIGAAKEDHSHAGEDITSGTIAVARLPVASASSAGITIVYPADSCTTFTSDSGTVTPLAVQKGAKMFAITRPGATTENGIVRYSNTTGDVKNSTILIEDVKNTADVSMSGSVISIPSSGGKKLVYGYCTDQVDGTAFIAGLFNSNTATFGYQEGLAIGGTTGNLLWKGDRVITETEFDEAVGDVSSAIDVINARQRYLIDGTNLTNNISEEEQE